MRMASGRAELETRLDAGEAAAIALAVEKAASIILIDERKGRRIAAEYGMRPVGVLGVLVQAKNRALIPAVRPLIDQLQKGIDFHLSPQLIAEVLRAAHE